ncbi:MAG: c-type cytochrome, partial [Nitrospirae bacterium]
KNPFGDPGSDIRFADRENPRLKMGVFGVRFRPDTHQLEALSGWSQYGQTFDEWGHHFTITNNSNGRHEVIAARYLRRNPELLLSTSIQDVSTADNNKVFPITRNPRFEILTDVGTLTSSCSITLPYLGGAFPAPFRRVGCMAEPAHNMVHCDNWSDAGATYSARRLQEGAEFLASTDAWFRPVNMYIGPDGALYLIDYYRNFIEHPEWMAAETYHSKSLYNGQDRGRIYRIIPNRQPSLPLPKNLRLGQSSDAELVQRLADPNIWWRRTAQRLLVERHHDVSQLLVQLFDGSQSPLGRVHALWTLDGLGKLDGSMLKKALDDPEPGVRENAIRLAEPRLQSDPELAEKLLKLTDDSDPKVRFQLLCTLGFLESAQAKAAEEKILAENSEDPWMQVTALSAPSARASGYFVWAASQFGDKRTKGHEGFFEQVCAVIGMRGRREEIRRLVATVASSRQAGSEWWCGASLNGLAHGVRAKGAPAISVLKANREQLLEMFESRPPAVRRASLQLLAVVGLPSSSSTAQALKRAEATARDRQAEASRRADAVGLLALANSSSQRGLFEQLIDPREPDELQIAALRAMSSGGASDAGHSILAKWREMSPQVRSEATRALLRWGSDGTRLLLDAVKNGDVQTWQLDPYKPRLFMDRDPKVREKARALFEESPAQRQKVLKDYQAALNMHGNPARGRDVFKRTCSKCHALDGVGTAVGPNLGTVRNHPSSALLLDILTPSRSIEQGYETYVVDLSSGEIVDGVMAAHTPATVTLRQEQGKEMVISRQDIQRMYVSNVSMMPNALEKEINVRQMADLLTFLKAVR